MMEKTDIRSLNLEELKAWFKERGEKPFRAGQLYQWMHQKLAGSFDEMTNLSKGLREKLAGETDYTVLKPVEILTSEIDGTQKYLFELKDGNVIESVLMKYHHGNSVCISSQVGCRMGCRFCASTIGWNEAESDRIGDAGGRSIEIQKISGERVSNLVLMGTGEPLDNYDNVRKFIRAAYRREWPTYQPEKRHPFHLRHCTEHPAAGRRGASDHAGALSSRVEPGEKGKTYAYCEAV